jgi:hypothetical protein
MIIATRDSVEAVDEIPKPAGCTVISFSDKQLLERVQRQFRLLPMNRSAEHCSARSSPPSLLPSNARRCKGHVVVMTFAKALTGLKTAL